LYVRNDSAHYVKHTATVNMLFNEVISTQKVNFIAVLIIKLAVPTKIMLFISINEQD